MKNLIIIGAGGCGREVLQWAEDVNEVELTWNIKGFLDDDKQALDGKKCRYEVIGTVDDYEICQDDLFICAIGNPVVREKVVNKMLLKGAQFTSVIHPTSVIADNAEIGGGAILYPYSIISDNAALEPFCIVNMHSCVAHDARLGKYCTISAFCDITGNTKLGDYVFMGSGVKLVPSVKIGDNAFICAGSIVMTNVREGRKVMGNPAKKIQL